MTKATFRHLKAEDAPWIPERFKVIIETDPALLVYGAFVDAECVAVGGIRVINDQSGEAFLILSESSNQHPAVYLQMKKVFAGMCRRFDRVQAMIDLYRPDSLRFARFLGMRPESILYRSGRKHQTYVMYVTIKGVDR